LLANLQKLPVPLLISLLQSNLLASVAGIKFNGVIAENVLVFEAK